jgi:hypothetical protein
MGIQPILSFSWNWFVKFLFHVRLNDCISIISWVINVRRAKDTLWAKLIWLILPAFAVALMSFFPSNAAAQGKKATSTFTVTSTSTPTITPTDSLIVFETPNTPTTDPQLINITNPLEGSLVMGMVNIIGKTAVSGFSHQELEFSFATNPTETWFLLARNNQPVTDDVLAVWDTGGITDGDYVLRLRVYFSDGSWRDTYVKGIKVRNHAITPPTVSTPTQKPIPTGYPTKTITPTPSPRATPSPFPANDAELPPSKIWVSLGRGAAITVILFLISGLLFTTRKKSL